MTDNKILQTKKKQKRVYLSEPDGKTFMLKWQDREVPCREDLSVLKTKVAAFPYMFYLPFRPVHEEKEGNVIFWVCQQKNCATVSMERDSQISSNLKKHLRNAHFDGDEWAKMLESESKPEKQQNSIEAFVLMVAKSGLPYYRFTATHSELKKDLESFGVQACCAKTFRKYLHEMSVATVENMFHALRGLRGHLITDASPSKVKNEYVDVTLFFIDHKGKFAVMPLGSRQVLGALSEETYGKVLFSIAQGWGARIALPQESWDAEKVLLDRKSVQEFVVVSSGSDMGPGAHGFLNKTLGAESHMPCCAHGANGINRDCVLIIPEVSAEVTALASFLKEISKTQRGREIMLTEKLTIPPKREKIRWNSDFALLTYYVQNYSAIRKLYDPADLPDFTTLSLLHAVMAPLASVVQRVQTIGPMDVLVVPMLLITALHDLIKTNLEFYRVVGSNESGVTVEKVKCTPSDLFGSELNAWLRVDQVRKFLIYRIFRRFFCNQFHKETSYQWAGMDKTRKWNIFENDHVLAAFALLPNPYGNFQFISDIGVEDSGSRKLELLAPKAQAVLIKFVRRMASDFDVRVCENTATSSSILPDLDDGPSDDPKEYVPIEQARLRSDNEAKAAFKKFKNSSFDKQARDTFLDDLLHVTESKRMRAMNAILRVIASKPLTTVKCETNFGVVQRLLDSTRLQTGTKTLSGYYLAALCRNWLKMPSQVSAKLRDANGAGVKRTLTSMWQNAAAGKALGTPHSQAPRMISSNTQAANHESGQNRHPSLIDLSSDATRTDPIVIDSDVDSPVARVPVAAERSPLLINEPGPNVQNEQNETSRADRLMALLIQAAAQTDIVEEMAQFEEALEWNNNQDDDESEEQTPLFLSI